MTIFLEPIIEVVAGFLLKQVIQRGPDYARKVGNQLKRPKLPRLTGFFVSRVRLINRDRELRAIQAVLSETPQSRVIYFSGAGGVGKTRLLEEAEHLAKNSRGSTPHYWAGILDLYHPDLRSALSLQDALAQRLDPDQTYFTRYRARRTRFEQRRRGGLSGSALDEERQALFNVFLQDYNAFVEHYRPVLAFDTLESLAHESDMIQTLCQLDTPVTTAWTWLLTQAKKLNNTVILLAGRPQPITGQKLKEKHNDTPGRLETISLEGLTRENSRRLLEYFLADAAPELRSLHRQTDQLWDLTKGLPVQLALVTELVAQNKQIDPMKLSNTANPTMWGRELVRTLFDYDNQETRLFFFLALARRGLTVDLLNFLSGWTVEACQKKLEDINRLSVVKTRPGSAETFLHDALYELFDAYFPLTDRLSYWYQRLVDYYRTQQSRAGNDREAWGKATISLLYYELQRNPRRAFEASYLRWDDIVIRGREHELDVQLRNEFLRFFNNASNKQRAHEQGLTEAAIERASAIRWVKRSLYQSNHQQAIELAETILGLGPADNLPVDPDPTPIRANIPPEKITALRAIFAQPQPFFWGQLLTYYGEALTFAGADEAHTAAILEQAVYLLIDERLQEMDPLSWLQIRVLGQAYHALGYLYRTYGHFSKAIAAYEQALRCFGTIKVEDEQAMVLNNLAFLLAQLGNYQHAQDYVDEALRYRQAVGQQYPLALSYNTRGLIYALQGRYDEGKTDCELALKIFQQVESERGLGLAYNALGVILRQQGEAWKTGRYSQEQATRFFRQAEQHLAQAAGILKDQKEERIRLWEAYSERGSLYCDWAYLLQQQGNDAEAEQKRTLAVEYHSKALEVAREHGLRFQEADTCDDLAQVAADGDDMAGAYDWLEQGVSLVPDQFRLTLNQRPDANAAPEGDFYRLILGKAHLQKGIWILRSPVDTNPTSAIEQGIAEFFLATLYFHHFWRSDETKRSKLRIMARHLNKNGVSIENVERYINRLAPGYRDELALLLQTMKDDIIDG